MKPDFKQRVTTALLEVRALYSGPDAAFAKQWGINNAVFSRLKNGQTDRLLTDTQWLSIGRELNVGLSERHWNMAETEVFKAIHNDVTFCQNNSVAMVLVDDCAIGKTYAARYLSRTLANCFYVDGSQAPTRTEFIRALAKAVGVESTGRLRDVKENTKYYLKMLPNPVVIIDEAGDLHQEVDLLLKEYWNYTDGICAWYMIGADGLRAKIERGIAHKKQGYRELLSRYSDKFISIIPLDKAERQAFYRKLIADVLHVNLTDKTRLNELVAKCMVSDANGKISGLRKAKTLLLLTQAA